jgi:hypothetical protein
MFMVDVGLIDYVNIKIKIKYSYCPQPKKKYNFRNTWYKEDFIFNSMTIFQFPV